MSYRSIRNARRSRTRILRESGDPVNAKRLHVVSASWRKPPEPAASARTNANFDGAPRTVLELAERHHHSHGKRRRAELKAATPTRPRAWRATPPGSDDRAAGRRPDRRDGSAPPRRTASSRDRSIGKEKGVDEFRRVARGGNAVGAKLADRGVIRLTLDARGTPSTPSVVCGSSRARSFKAIQVARTDPPRLTRPIARVYREACAPRDETPSLALRHDARKAELHPHDKECAVLGILPTPIRTTN